MPLKVIKGATIDQIEQEFSLWEAKALEQKVAEHKQLQFRYPGQQIPPMGLQVGQMILQECPYEVTPINPAPNTPMQIKKGWVLLFNHN